MLARDVQNHTFRKILKTHGWRGLPEKNSGVELRDGARHEKAQNSSDCEQCQRVYGCSLKPPSDAVPQVDRDTTATRGAERVSVTIYMSVCDHEDVTVE